MLVSAPGQVAAQSASAEALLEEVVVTARRREESLQDLPLSVAAISSDAMQAQGIYDIKDITEFVPNVAFRDQDRRGRVSIFIRGIGIHEVTIQPHADVEFKVTLDVIPA